MKLPTWWQTAASAVLMVGGVHGISLDVNKTASVSNAARQVAKDVMHIYSNQSTVPGLFGPPYYFCKSSSKIWFFQQDGESPLLTPNGADVPTRFAEQQLKAFPRPSGIARISTLTPESRGIWACVGFAH